MFQEHVDGYDTFNKLPTTASISSLNSLTIFAVVGDKKKKR